MIAVSCAVSSVLNPLPVNTGILCFFFFIRGDYFIVYLCHALNFFLGTFSSNTSVLFQLRHFYYDKMHIQSASRLCIH